MVILQSSFLEDRVFKLEKDFKEKFESISILIDDLEGSLRRAIEQLKPQELDTRVALLEEYNRLLKYKDELKAIDVDVQASEEASNWLDKNRQPLIKYVRSQIFDDDFKLRRFSNLQASREVIQLFCQDLDFYLRWIGHYLRMACPPKEMPKGVIALVLPLEIYIEAFRLIRNDKVSMSSGLSERAVTMLRSSINRFLIKRQLELDVIST